MKSESNVKVGTKRDIIYFMKLPECLSVLIISKISWSEFWIRIYHYSPKLNTGRSSF